MIRYPVEPVCPETGREPSSHVNRRASLLVKPWGETNTNELPRYERIAKMLLTLHGGDGDPFTTPRGFSNTPRRNSGNGRSADARRADEKRVEDPPVQALPQRVAGETNPPEPSGTDSSPRKALSGSRAFRGRASTSGKRCSTGPSSSSTFATLTFLDPEAAQTFADPYSSPSSSKRH